MLNECVNCYSKIIIKSDGKCPACGKSATIKDGPIDVARVDIIEAARCPGICSQCGTTTEKTIGITKKRQVGGESLLVRILLAIARPATLWNSTIKGKRQSVTISVPLCEDCKNRTSIEVKHVDYDKAFMNIVVHSKFREAYLI